MTFEDIKQTTLEINELGHYIVRIYNLLQTMPEDLQPQFAEQLLEIIKSYHQDINELKHTIEQYKKENVVIDISLEKLKKDLEKFDMI